MTTVEIRVRPVTRWNITRHESDPERGGSTGSVGEYDSERQANDMALALKAQEPMARVVTSDGTVHDPAKTVYVVVGYGANLGDIECPVFYAYSQADLDRVCAKFMELYPDRIYNVYSQTSVDALTS